METDTDGFDKALARARSGDEAGFLVLWEALHPRLLRYLQVLGCDDVDDVASETWLQAVRDLHRFKKGGADEFRAWLFTIGRHRAVDEARSRTRYRDKILTTGQASPPQTVHFNPVEDEVLAGLSTRQAVALVAGLSRDQAEVVALRIIAGLDTEAVARILRKSPGAVRVALHRGLRTLSEDPRIRDIEKVEQ
ncbi:RNA polymerase sigma factor [Trebonia sp.]|uniref:RNA polymerase sigma factor n=1 Tax=Trebonia sp. TaxID=2767075 RepID=UPI002606ACF8|nr:RNA polymerase sigma factor [Trebonia sp.]